MEFIPKEEALNNFLQTINSFGKVYLESSLKFKECPNVIVNNKKYTLFEGKKNHDENWSKWLDGNNM